MARIFRATYSKLRTVKDRRGRVIYDIRNGRKVARRKPVLGKDGKPLQAKSRKWYVEFRDANGKVRRKAGYTDRKATEQLAAKLERQIERQRVGIVDIDVDHLQRPLEEHVADYLADLQRAGRDDMYVYNIDKRLHKLADECGWNTLASMSADSLTHWLKKRQKTGAAPRTLNQYVQTAAGLLNWAIQQKRAEINPLLHIARANEADRRRIRRALSFEEIGRLLDVAADRRLVYLTAMLTGLRRSELAALVWSDVHLDDKRPLILLRALQTKSRRADKIELPPELADALAEARPADATDATPVFDEIPSMDVFRDDLKAADIPYKDEMNRQIDFHALRMTYGTILAQAGVPIRAAMELMRHTDIRLTTRVYTDPTLLNTAGVVRSLPELGSKGGRERQKATGTYDDRAGKAEARLAFCLASKGASEHIDQSPPRTTVEGIDGKAKNRKLLEMTSVATSRHSKESPCHSRSNRGSRTSPTRT